MNKLWGILVLIWTCAFSALGQTYPTFGPEIDVTINGLLHDAMDPHISSDGTHLYFNNLNDGIETGLFYAIRVDDSTFTYMGEVNGANQPTVPRYDAIATRDSADNFMWISDRDPGILENVQHGFIDGSNIVSAITPVYGDFYITAPGWQVVDLCLNEGGENLIVSNAYYDTCYLPCQTFFVLAERSDVFHYYTAANSYSVLQNVNDQAYVAYSPYLSSDGKEFYYTRAKIGTELPTDTIEVCVAVRANETDVFSLPRSLFMSTLGGIAECPTLSSDMSLMYYHRFENGLNKIKLRKRLSPVTPTPTDTTQVNATVLFPNPASAIVKIHTEVEPGTISVYDINGALVMKVEGKLEFDVSSLGAGEYQVLLQYGTVLYSAPLIVQ